MGIRERCWKLCLASALLGGLVGSLSAENPPTQPVIGLYDGAVAIEPYQNAGRPLSLTNPQTMTNAPLQDVLARVEELTQLQVHVDWQSLLDNDVKIGVGTKIPEWPVGESIHQLLERIPGQEKQELTWVVDDNLISLTTAERAGERYTTKRYYIGDLLSEAQSAEFLVEILQQETSGPWHSDEPGTGTITPFGNYLFVRQTSGNQRQVQGLLEALRRPEPIVLIGRSQEDLRLRRILEEKVVSFDWPEMTLAEFAQRLTEMTGAKFKLDEQALTDEGLDTDTLIVARSKNLPLSQALDIVLSNVNGTELMIVIEDGVFHIISGEKYCGVYETILYNVGWLGITGERLEEFVSLLEQETSGPWDAEEPGTGMISAFPHRSSLLVRQTPNVQREILVLLRDLRFLPKDEPLFVAAKDGGKHVRTKYYRMAPETAEALAKLIPESIAIGTWELDDSKDVAAHRANPSAKQETEPKAEPPRGRITVVRIPVGGLELLVLDPTIGKLQVDKKPLPATPIVYSGYPSSYLAITHTPEVHASVLRLLKGLLEIPPKHPSPGSGFFTIPVED